MAHLHELIAVDRDLESVMNKILKETFNTFTKKPDHFRGHSKRLRMFDEDRKSEEPAYSEDKDIVTTVIEKLEYTARSSIQYVDAALQRESTNQLAKGTIKIGLDTIIAEDVPVTFLLGLEKLLVKWREVFSSIPTLDPGTSWEKDKSLGKNIYKAVHDEIRAKTEKIIEHKIVVQPTEHHPAQVESFSFDKQTGEYTQVNWSGLVSPAKKSQMIENIDTLIKATKQARMRANEQKVNQVKIGTALFNYILKNDK